MTTFSKKAVFLDWASLSQNDIDQAALRNAYPSWEFKQNTLPGDLNAALQNAEVVVSNKVLLDLDTLPASCIEQLRLICVAATGYNNVNLEAAKQRGITVCNVRDYATQSVTQHVFALLLTLCHKMLDYDRDVRNGLWSKSPFFSLFHHPIMELSGKTLGIIGYGVLGRSVAAHARAFGMKVLISEHPSVPAADNVVDLARLLQRSDVVTLHCPLNQQTLGLIGEKEFRLMKPNAILINAARGGIVDEAALLDALQRNEIQAAALDVLSVEPPPADHPLLQAGLPNLLVTPHIAWASLQARQALVDGVAANIQAFLSGQPRNTV